jgi:hypothetical protein
MVNKYKLVNPYIKGEFETKVDAKNSVEAAKVFYKTLSEHFNNSVPKFYFTIQKGGSGKGKFFHFVVNEKRKNEDVDYSIKPYEIKGEEQAMKNYLANFENFKGRYNGGARKGSRSRSKKSSRKSSKHVDISSDSSDAYYREATSYIPVASQPFTYMYYDPIVYQVDTVFFPTFYSYNTPFLLFNANTSTNYTYVV